MQFSLTVSKAVNEGEKIIHYLNHPEAVNMAKVVLIKILKTVDLVLSLSKPVSPPVYHAAVNMIITQYKFYTFEEVALVLKNGTLGNYGQIYNRFDLNVLHEWFVGYEGQERADYFERRSHDLKHPPGSAQETGPHGEKARDLASAIAEALKRTEARENGPEQNVKVASGTDPARVLERIKEIMQRAQAEVDHELLKNWYVAFKEMKYKPGTEYIIHVLKERSKNAKD